MMAEQTPTEIPDIFGDDESVLAGMDELDASETSDDLDQQEAGDELSDSDDESAEPAEQEDEQESEEEAKAEPAEEPAPPEDAELTKRLEAIQKAEERQKASVEEYKRQAEQAVAAKEAELAPKLEELKNFEKVREQAAYDPVGALTALGLKPDSFEHAARLLYSMRPGAEQDPRTRDAAQRAMRERKHGDELSTLKEELQALKQAQVEREQQAQQAQEQAQKEQAIGQYLDKIASSVTDETPLVKNMLAKNPEKTKKLLREIGDQLADEYQMLPEPADIAKRFEQVRRAELEELGIDPDAAIKATPKNQTQTAGETKAAKTLSNELGTPTRPRTEPKTEAELDQEILAEMEL